jgi:hypothetical protein
MSNFTPVKPGDLITAAYFNQVLGSFDARISALESASPGGGQIVIQQLLPLGTFYVQNQMHVVGKNFGLPANLVVTVGGQQVTSFAAGSGDTDLYFDIPSVQGLAQGGSLVSLVIDNSTSPAPASTSFTLFPQPLTSPSGNILVKMTGPPSVGTVTAGNSFVYVFTVTGFTSLTDTYAVSVALDAASLAAGWTAVPVDSTGTSPLPTVQIPQGQNTTTLVGVKVSIPGTAAALSVAQVTVALASSLKPGVSGSGGTSVTVNAAPPPPNAIGLTIFSTGAGTVSTDGSTVSLPSGTSSVVIIFLASLPDGGTGVSYAVSKLTFDSNLWTATLQGPSDIPVGTPNSTAQIRFSISVPPGTNSTKMHLTLTEDGKPSVQGTQTFNISVS